MKQVAIYDSRGSKLTGFDLDEDFVTSFDEGIYWYASFSSNAILIGSRINNVKNAHSGRYNRYAIFVKFERKSGKLNLIKSFEYLYLFVRKYFESNGFIWDDDFYSFNECDIEGEEHQKSKKIISTLIKKGKAEIAIKVDESSESAIRKNMKILSHWQRLIDEFEEYIYKNNIVMCYGHKNINADIWFNLNNRDNLEFNEIIFNAFKNAAIDKIPLKNIKNVKNKIRSKKINQLKKQQNKNNFVIDKNDILKNKRKSTNDIFKKIFLLVIIGVAIATIIIILLVSIGHI